MTYVAVVIVDAQVARDQEVARNLAYNIAIRPGIPQGQVKMLSAIIEKSHGTVRPVGTLHTVVALECPHGMDNCRNCGDPETPCTGPDHCPLCGRSPGHGCAPDRIVRQGGYKLVPIEGRIPKHKVWDPVTETVVER